MAHLSRMLKFKPPHRNIFQVLSCSSNSLSDPSRLVRGLESDGLPSKQAQGTTAAVNDVLNKLQDLNRLMLGDAKLQELSLLQRETMKELSEVEKMVRETRPVHEAVEYVKLGCVFAIGFAVGFSATLAGPLR